MASNADRSRMNDIIARLRRGGVEVLEVPGWPTRGADWARVPRGMVDHHDASTRKSGEWGALGVIRDGRPGIPGPLSQFQIGRGLDGVPRVAIVAAGRANHAGKGGPLLGAPRDSGNSWLYGAEAANDGVSEPYTDAAHRAHDVLFRAVLDVCRVGTSNLVGHREWAPGRKSDPRYDMGWRRARVAALAPGGSTSLPPPAAGSRPLLRQGSVGQSVADVQTFMRRVFPTYAGGLAVDGHFGPAMRAAVVEFQRRSGLDADGVIGPATWARLATHGYR